MHTPDLPLYDNTAKVCCREIGECDLDRVTFIALNRDERVYVSSWTMLLKDIFEDAVVTSVSGPFVNLFAGHLICLNARCLKGPPSLLHSFVFQGATRLSGVLVSFVVSYCVIPFSPTAASIRLAVTGDFFFIVDVDAGAAA